MKSTRELSLIAMFTALLIGVQFALSFTYGLELVSVTLAMFSLVFGSRRGFVVGVAFSLLRLMIFGFYPTVAVLYLTYYPLYAVAVGQIGKIKGKKQFVVLLVAVSLMTVCFSLLDDVITPLIMGFNNKAWLTYFYGSFLAMVPQTICVFISTAVLYYPLKKLLGKLKVRFFPDECETVGERIVPKGNDN